MFLIDTHSHINFHAFDKDAFDVIQRTTEQNIGIINVGSQIDTSKKAVEYAEKFKNKNVWAAVGLHPSHTASKELRLQDENKELEVIKTRTEIFDYTAYKSLAKNPRVVAIGEIGLENLGEGVSEKMISSFKEQIELSLEMDLPIIVHSRGANSKVLKILEEIKNKDKSLRGVMHFFNGSKEEAKKLFDLDFLISFTGVITFARQYDGIIKWAPLEKIMIETDSPFVTPIPHRGKRNEPIFVKYVAEKIAEIKNITFEKVSKQTTENAKKLFNL